MIKDQCNLLFTSTDTGEDRLPTIVKTARKVACENRGTYTAKYYSEQSRTMRDSVNLSISRAYLRLGILMRVEFNGILYDVKNIMNDKKRGFRFVILDCEEVKTRI